MLTQLIYPQLAIVAREEALISLQRLLKVSRVPEQKFDYPKIMNFFAMMSYLHTRKFNENINLARVIEFANFCIFV